MVVTAIVIYIHSFQGSIYDGLLVNIQSEVMGSFRDVFIKITVFIHV